MPEYDALSDAWKIVNDAALAVASGPTPVWRKLDSTRRYLAREIERLISE